MHPPVNFIVCNEIYRGRIAEAETARLVRENRRDEGGQTSRRRPWTFLLRRTRARIA